jgi:hypothetical protein
MPFAVAFFFNGALVGLLLCVNSLRCHRLAVGEAAKTKGETKKVK